MYDGKLRRVTEQKQKVWAVYDSIIEEILGIYDSEEKARKVAEEEENKAGYTGIEVQEFEVQ